MWSMMAFARRRRVQKTSETTEREKDLLSQVPLAISCECCAARWGKQWKSLPSVTFPIKRHPLGRRCLMHLRNLHIFKGTRSVGHTSYRYTTYVHNIFLKLDTCAHTEALQQRPKVGNIIYLILRLRTLWSVRTVNGVSHESLVDATAGTGVHGRSSLTGTSPFLLSLFAWLSRHIPIPRIALGAPEDTRRRWES